jgi:hypothetical protein
MRSKKTYLAFFYGSKTELTKAFTTITDGDYVRYIMTSETLICRFKSQKSLDDIMTILREYAKDIPFFVFPISSKNWKYNLPMDVENNLLTDNPIMQIQDHENVNQYFLSMLEEIKKSYGIVDGFEGDDIFDRVIKKLNKELKQSVRDDNYELAAQIRDKLKEIEQQKNGLNGKNEK